MAVNVDELCKQWLELDKNESTRAEIIDLQAAGNTAALEERLGSTLKFGTAGLRAAMGAGFSRMNDLTVIQASQGLCKYVIEQVGSSDFKVLIGYDGRHHSEQFARLAATAFLSQGAHVFLFSKMVPTPFVAYGTRKLGCAAGVMVTASHNPKEDNGYKVYWSNGAQINSPHDKGIANHIDQNRHPWADAWNASLYENHPKYGDPLAIISENYMKDILIHSHLDHDAKRDVAPVTYTAMHGVGYLFVKQAFEAFGLPHFIEVKSQIHADPEFPTVKYPNPEEGKGALKLAMETADANNSRHIIANDPDADRLAVAEKQRDGSWRIFTGNETASLFASWLWSSYLKKHPAQTDHSKIAMVGTNVSSKLLEAMANKEGFHYEETLTGFKWVGNASLDLEKRGYEVLFSFEEAIGFCVGTTNVDKDGLSAAVAMTEFIQFLSSQNKTLSDELTEIYHRYGYHSMYNSYYICRSPPTIERIFNAIRANYPKQLGSHVVSHVIDLTVGYDSRASDHKAKFPKQSGQVITFILHNGGIITFRTSGTEPKIKFYSEYRAEINDSSIPEINAQWHETVESFVQALLEPSKNGIQPKSE